MTSPEDLRTIRSNAMTVARNYEAHKAALYSARKEASKLASEIYALAGIEPPIEPERWEWSARGLPLKLMGVCDEALLKVTDPDVRQTIEAVRTIVTIFDGARLAYRSPSR
jgi:hypothetical protein